MPVEPFATTAGTEGTGIAITEKEDGLPLPQAFVPATVIVPLAADAE